MPALTLVFPRRSGRATKAASSSEEGGRSGRGGSSGSGSSSEEEWSEEEQPKKAQVKRKKPAPKKSAKKRKAESDDESEEEKRWATSRATRGAGGTDSKTKKPDYVVPDTDEDVDEDTVQSWTVEEEGEQDTAPTVERVLDLRQGSERATGPGTTTYSVESRGDPNDGEGGTERQYLVKWKGYSHLHNTWESDYSLRELQAKGVKKVRLLLLASSVLLLLLLFLLLLLLQLTQLFRWKTSPVSRKM